MKVKLAGVVLAGVSLFNLGFASDSNLYKFTADYQTGYGQQSLSGVCNMSGECKLNLGGMTLRQQQEVFILLSNYFNCSGKGAQYCQAVRKISEKAIKPDASEHVHAEAAVAKQESTDSNHLSHDIKAKKIKNSASNNKEINGKSVIKTLAHGDDNHSNPIAAGNAPAGKDPVNSKKIITVDQDYHAKIDKQVTSGKSINPKDANTASVGGAVADNKTVSTSSEDYLYSLKIQPDNTLLFNLKRLAELFGWHLIVQGGKDVNITSEFTIKANTLQDALNKLIAQGYPIEASMYKNKVLVVKIG
ncbi:hypothetical protein [Cysteiniphilum halobium]|uniref:hypothetical protein n=1 Tax=Cysteiniphilum halobium TaxID=2219059 RepID=UPI003F87197B